MHSMPPGYPMVEKFEDTFTVRIHVLISTQSMNMTDARQTDRAPHDGIGRTNAGIARQ